VEVRVVVVGEMDGSVLHGDVDVGEGGTGCFAVVTLAGTGIEE
jgi:hypothetical protein